MVFGLAGVKVAKHRYRTKTNLLLIRAIITCLWAKIPHLIPASRLQVLLPLTLTAILANMSRLSRFI